MVSSFRLGPWHLSEHIPNSCLHNSDFHKNPAISSRGRVEISKKCLADYHKNAEMFITLGGMQGGAATGVAFADARGLSVVECSSDSGA